MLANDDKNSTSPRVPTELCLAIIDEVAVSPKSDSEDAYHHRIHVNFEVEINAAELKRCAQVSRGWRTRAQFWLFRYVYLDSLDRLRLLESQLSLYPEYLLGVHGIYLACTDMEGYEYPSRLVPTVVHSLLRLRKCPLVRYISICGDRRSSVSILDAIQRYNEDDSHRPYVHPYLPFNSRLHSALFRQSFRTITHLSLNCVWYHSDTDFFSFLSTFTSLETLFLNDIDAMKCEWIKQPEYIQLLKKKGIMDKLRSLSIVRGPF